MCFAKTSRGREPTADHQLASTSCSERQRRRWISFQDAQQVYVSVAQEGEDAPLSSFCLLSRFVLPADSLRSWIHGSHWTSLLYHLTVKHTFFRAAKPLSSHN